MKRLYDAATIDPPKLLPGFRTEFDLDGFLHPSMAVPVDARRVVNAFVGNRTNWFAPDFDECTPIFDDLWVETGPNHAVRLQTYKADANGERPMNAYVYWPPFWDDPDDVYLSPVIIPLTLMDDGRLKPRAQDWAPVGFSDGPVANADMKWFSEVEGDDRALHTMVEMNLSLVGAALSVMSLIHCKNVEHDLEPPRHTTKAKRRRLGRDPVRFITILLPGDDRSSGGKAGDGNEMPWHQVRGHFVEYQPERPLFGKLTGRFWHPAHVRGNPAVGVNLHSYEVKVEEEQGVGPEDSLPPVPLVVEP